MNGLHKFMLLLMVICAYTWVNDPGHVFTVDAGVTSDGPHIAVESYTTSTDETPGRDIFNPESMLDDSNVRYIDTMPVILPSDNAVVTRTVLFDGTYIPEESPDGGYPIDWADNSPVYSDGWILQVNDSTGITQWHECNTDIECGA